MFYHAKPIKYLNCHPCRAVTPHTLIKKTERHAFKLLLPNKNPRLINCIHQYKTSEKSHASSLQTCTTHLSNVQNLVALKGLSEWNAHNPYCPLYEKYFVLTTKTKTKDKRKAFCFQIPIEEKYKNSTIISKPRHRGTRLWSQYAGKSGKLMSSRSASLYCTVRFCLI